MIGKPDLSEHGEEYYAAIVGHLEAGGRMRPELVPAVARYSEALALARRAWEELRDAPLVGKTDRGGERIHPAAQIALAAEEAAARWGQALGLEPVRQPAQTGR